MEPIVYAYSGCGTCKKALQWLAQRGHRPQVHPIRETPPPLEDLRGALAQGIPLQGLFNTSGGDYREMALKDRLPKLSTDEALELLASRGNLVKRPFVKQGKRYLVGFREPEWEGFFR